MVLEWLGYDGSGNQETVRGDKSMGLVIEFDGSATFGDGRGMYQQI